MRAPCTFPDEPEPGDRVMSVNTTSSYGHVTVTYVLPAPIWTWPS